MLRYAVASAVLLVVWVHWRAAHVGAVRAALDDVAAHADELDDLLHDLRDNRLVYRCRAVLADQRAGDPEALREHLAAAYERLEHLERFAPLRRFLSRADD